MKNNFTSSFNYVLPILISGILLLVPATASASDFIGTWRAGNVHSHTHHPDGDHTGEMEISITIESIHDGILHGNTSWQLTDDHGGLAEHVGLRVHAATSNVVGIVDFDENHAHLLTTSDNGVFHLKLIDKNRIQASYTEQGHNEAMVFRAVLKRHHNE